MRCLSTASLFAIMTMGIIPLEAQIPDGGWVWSPYVGLIREEWEGELKFTSGPLRLGYFVNSRNCLEGSWGVLFWQGPRPYAGHFNYLYNISLRSEKAVPYVMIGIGASSLPSPSVKRSGDGPVMLRAGLRSYYDHAQFSYDFGFGLWLLTHGSLAIRLEARDIWVNSSPDPDRTSSVLEWARDNSVPGGASRSSLAGASPCGLNNHLGM